MSAKSYIRGHPITNNGCEWVYKDIGLPTLGNERLCGHCGKEDTPEGHDGCLGTLPSVMNACCGHGHTPEAYVQYWDDSIVSGEKALVLIESLKLQQ